MKKMLLILIFAILVTTCEADTFTHKKTGKVTYGYSTTIERDGKTLIHAGKNHTLKKVNLTDYDIEYNYNGRRNQIIVIPITNEIDLEYEKIVFVKTIENAQSQGPLFIVIEIDTPGGKYDLMKQICDSIVKTDNCRTVAFISGGKYGGAYSAGAYIALACDYIYVADGTAIGAAASVLISSSGTVDVKKVLGDTVEAKMVSSDRAYISSLAQANNRPELLAQAMVDKSIEVWEVVENNRSIFISSENITSNQVKTHVWSKEGSLLTLSATEAVSCGIADKLINSMNELISDFKASDASVIYKKQVMMARQEVEQARQTVKETYNEIDLLQKRINALSKFVTSTTNNYNREIQTYNHYVVNSYYYSRSSIKSQGKLVETISMERRQYLQYSIAALQQLISKYQKVLYLNNTYSDLNIETEALEKEINSATTMLHAYKVLLVQ